MLAYRRAATRIRETGASIAELALAGKAKELPGIGATIEAKIVEIAETGEMSALEKRRAEVPDEVTQFLRLPGLGPKTAARIWRELGVTTLDGLREAAEQQRVRDAPGPRREERGADPRGAREGLRAGARAPGPARPGPAGRARGRRGAARAPGGGRRLGRGQRPARQGDVPRPRRDRDRDRPGRADSRTSSRCRGCSRSPRTATRRRRSSRSRGCASTCASSRPRTTAACSSTSPARRITTSRCARTRSAAGFSVSEYGVTVVETGEVHRFATEDELYRFLGYDLIPPELRENGGELAAARDGRLPALVELADLVGELHCHSTWSSDGKASIEEMARAAKALGEPLPRAHRPLALPPRRPDGGPVGGDRGGERARQAVPRAPRGRGEHPAPTARSTSTTTCSRSSTGSSPRSTRRFDRNPTERVLAAIDHPHVDCIGHLTGRKLNRRPGADIDVERVVARAAETGTALEINSQPDRLDMRDVHARLAGEAGVLDPDHHRRALGEGALLPRARRRPGPPRLADEGADPQHAPVARDREAARR